MLFTTFVYIMKSIFSYYALFKRASKRQNTPEYYIMYNAHISSIIFIQLGKSGYESPTLLAIEAVYVADYSCGPS